MAAVVRHAIATAKDDEEDQGENAEQLKKQIADLEERLQEEPLSFQVKMLQVQLEQMQDDYSSLQDDFRSMREYYSKRIADMQAQLEERARRASSAEGHADCLQGLLSFHEDNGLLAGSYWQAQCEKRDDSIRFLTLKLQEYTVLSSEYWVRRRSRSAGSGSDDDHGATSLSSVERTESADCGGGSSPEQEAQRPAAGQSLSPEPSPSSATKASSRAFEQLLLNHVQFCEELQVSEAEASAVQEDLEACQLRSAALRAKLECWKTAEDPSKLSEDESGVEEENIRLKDELRACQEALASVPGRGQLPSWAQRCAWRDELDLRAGQLERISLQFDATKRSLDAANEELQWQATSAEGLRVRLAEVLRASTVEAQRSEEVRAEEEKRSARLQALLQRWSALRPGSLPSACQQAKQLLETIRKGREEEQQQKRLQPPEPASSKQTK